MATLVVRYIDPDATGLNDGTSWENAYTSISAWTTGEASDLVATNEIHTVYLRSSGGSEDTTATVFTGWNTDATHYVEMIGDWNTGYYDTTKYRLHVAAGDCFKLQEQYIRLRNIQFWSDNGNCITFFISASGVNITIDSCLLRGNNTKTFSGALYTTNAGSGTVKLNIINNLIYDFTGAGQSGIYLTGANRDFYLYNNTVINCTRGIRIASSNVEYVKNNQVDCPDAFYGTFVNNDTYNDYNYSSQNANDDVLGSHGAFNQVFLYENAPIDNFIVAEGSPVIGRGVDLSANPDTPFDNSIRGLTRVVPWDVGAYKYVSPAGDISGKNLKLQLGLSL